jgi:hypothetical protein
VNNVLNEPLYNSIYTAPQPEEEDNKRITIAFTLVILALFRNFTFMMSGRPLPGNHHSTVPARDKNGTPTPGGTSSKGLTAPASRGSQRLANFTRRYNINNRPLPKAAYKGHIV